MAFAMRDEWKEEPVSTTGAEYVEPSATELIKPGQRVSHLFPRAVMEEFVLQRVTERVWWVTRQFYGSLFYVGKRGVLLFDSFLGGADATLAAIASVTSLPVTAVVYSHFHADHVGGSRRLFELLAAAPPRVIASKNTAIWMSRFRSYLPRPTDVLDWPSGAVRFEDVTVRLAGFPFPPEWTAARQQAVDEAVPKIIERLRPKYGRMYNFDDAQPFNVRLMAMDMQVTMSNR